MLFHTWTFAIFFLLVYSSYLLFRGTRVWPTWLLAASYVFYGWWNPYYLVLIVYSTVLDYWVVGRMARLSAGNSSDEIGSLNVRRRCWLWVSIINNLSLLFFFKYATFVVLNVNALLGRLGGSFQFDLPETWMPFGWEFLLPVGISFYTFQSLSYTIDFYRGKIEQEKDFTRFACFVAFFPQLVAGPIERASRLLPQFRQSPAIRRLDLTDGLSLILVGLFKKLALANYLSFYVERVYGDPSQQGSAALMLATVAFAWQIYFDFSGYTDMARGLARMMGFHLMLNFNHPYLATSLSDFWSRWHISLSTWFRDYVYIPLGGNRGGSFATYRNLFVTFVISGLWHGAAWTFLIWGGLHALGTMATRWFESRDFYRDRIPMVAKRVGVFIFVCFAWIFFRAESLEEAGLIVRRIFIGGWTDPGMPLLMLALIGLIWVYQWLHESRFRVWLSNSGIKVVMAIGMILYLFLFSAGGGEFIYFQF